MKNKTKLTAEELASFCSQAALMYSAGMTLYDGLQALTEEGRADSSDLLYELSERMEQTGSLHDAMKGDERWPAYMVGMVDIGERTGNLEKVMSGLADFYEREDRLRHVISGAIAYPISLGLMLCAIVLIMLIVVLPVFRQVMQSLGVGMGESGSKLMSLGAVIGYVVLGVVLAAAIAVGCVFLAVKTGHKDQVLTFFQKRVPAFKKLNRHLSASRVANVLAMTISGGYPMDEALELVPQVLSDTDAQARVRKMHEQIADGAAFIDALDEADLFDPLHERLMRMAVRAGQEEQVMNRISAAYEEQAQESISRLVSIIEPSLVALLAIVVGAILLSVMLPLAGILTSIL